MQADSDKDGVSAARRPLQLTRRRRGFVLAAFHQYLNPHAMKRNVFNTSNMQSFFLSISFEGNRVFCNGKYYKRLYMHMY